MKELKLLIIILIMFAVVLTGTIIVLNVKQEETNNNEIIIKGKDMLTGGVAIDPKNDHRLLMMVVALTSKYQERVTILNAECVSKSYPNFWDDYRKLKGIAVDSTNEEIMRGQNE